MQPHALLHPRMPHQVPLRKEIRRQLHRASEAGPHHRRPGAAVPALDPLIAVDAAEGIDRAFVFVLRADGEERTVGLETGLYEEQRGSEGGAHDAGGGAGDDVDTEGLGIGGGVNEGGEGGTDGFVEAETAAVEEDLVTVGGLEAGEEAAGAFVAEDDGDTLEDAGVDALAGAGKFSLQLETGE